MKIFALRLKPDQDLRKSLKGFAQDNLIQAGFILTAIGSLKQAIIRFANQSNSTTLEGPFEIISLAGTVSVYGVHLHIAISNEIGEIIGGHLDNGSIICTTAEIVMGESKKNIFCREFDEQTGYNELKILPKGQ
jgi:predicted DNA-binding protein with PD1-like motif